MTKVFSDHFSNCMIQLMGFHFLKYAIFNGIEKKIINEIIKDFNLYNFLPRTPSLE